jgi:hypothetical protein
MLCITEHSIMSVSKPAVAAMAALGFSTFVAFGHDAKTLDMMAAAHGGQVRMAGPYHVELLLNHNGVGDVQPVQIFLQNHAFISMPSGGTTATVLLTDGTHKWVIHLRPDGPNSLGGKGRYMGYVGVTAFVSIHAKDGQTWTATFTPFSPPALAPANGSRH